MNRLFKTVGHPESTTISETFDRLLIIPLYTIVELDITIQNTEERTIL